MKSLRRTLLWGALAAAMLLPATGDAAHRIYVRHRPPASRVVVVPRPPFAGAVWMHGHWRWNSRCYVWVDGRYVRPRKGFVYVPGHWQHNRYGWHWVEGYWRRG